MWRKKTVELLEKRGWRLGIPCMSPRPKRGAILLRRLLLPFLLLLLLLLLLILRFFIGPDLVGAFRCSDRAEKKKRHRKETSDDYWRCCCCCCSCCNCRYTWVILTSSNLETNDYKICRPPQLHPLGHPSSSQYQPTRFPSSSSVFSASVTRSPSIHHFFFRYRFLFLFFHGIQVDMGLLNLPGSWFDTFHWYWMSCGFNWLQDVGKLLNNNW